MEFFTPVKICIYQEGERQLCEAEAWSAKAKATDKIRRQGVGYSFSGMGTQLEQIGAVSTEDKQ